MDAPAPFEDSPAALRQRALRAMAAPEAAEAVPGSASPTEIDPHQTLHELRVHQIELEMQNEALRQAHRELEAASERWFELYDLAPVAYCTLSEGGLITQANLAAASLLGLPRHALVGQGLAQFVEVGDQPRFRALCKALSYSRGPQACELRMTGALGPPRWVQLSATAQPGRSDSGSLRIVLVDVTTRRQAEAAEAALHLAQESYRSRNEFLSRVSHEFRTPLNAILGFSYLLMHAEDSPQQPGDRLQLSHIHDAGTHLLQLVTDLLDVSSLASGKLVLHPVPVDALGLLRRLIPELGLLARARSITLALEAPAEAVVTVLADATRLRQVLQNLLSNAIKYNRAGGHVTVRVLRLPASWRLSIVDDGLGMSTAQQAALFQPFNRLGRESAGIEGSGLGLVITNDLVLAMGGRLTVHSEASVGSEFSVDLPACDPPATAKTGGAEADMQVRADIQGRLVCVDPDAGNRALLTGILARRPGVVLELVATGAECLAAARRAWPDLLLINQSLPDMPGLDVLRVLRQRNPHLPMRCLVWSAQATADDIRQAHLAGADDCLGQPIDPGRLLQRLDQLLGGGLPGR